MHTQRGRVRVHTPGGKFRSTAQKLMTSTKRKEKEKKNDFRRKENDQMQ